MRTGSLIILDDYNRKAEKTIVRSWISAFQSSLKFTEIKIGHGLAILEKQNHVEPKMIRPECIIDNLLVNMRLAFKQFRRSTRTIYFS